MQSIHALSLAPDVNDWLVNSRQPRILHVFDHACNLINEHREVLSIVTPQIGNGPFNLVIDGDVLFSDHLSLQSQISIFPNQLRLGDLTIHTGDAKLWPPRPDWKRLHAKKDYILEQILSLRASDIERGKLHFREGIASSQRVIALLATTGTQLPITNYQFYNSLGSALASVDVPSSLTAAQQLAGLGIGLTPAGDDFIMGAILAAWIIHPFEVASVLAEEITRIAAPLTTSLSAAWLKSAGRGEAGIFWHDFFDALSSGDSFAIQLQFTKLLSIGHTSGADALAGFFGVFISYAESETKLCHS